MINIRRLTPLALVAGGLAIGASAPLVTTSSPTQQTAGMWLIDGTYSQVSTIAASEGWRVIRCNAPLDYCIVERPASTARRFLPPAVVAEPERVFTATAGPLSTEAVCVIRQWHQRLMNTGAAWQRTHGQGTRIAVVDSGVGPHPDTPVTLGASFTRDDNNPGYTDDLGHGTHVAGIAAGRESADCTAGVAYEAEILSAKALAANGNGLTSWISDAIVWSADNGADVINLSLGGAQGSAVMQRALQYAVSKGAVPVCAAGNDGTSNRQYPAAYPECVPVAATDSEDDLASFSTWGDWVLIGAPGVSIYSAWRATGGHVEMSGTSMAAPVVSGVMALVMSLGVDGPTARTDIQLNTDPIRYTGSKRLATGAGRVSPVRAVAAISGPVPSPTPSLLPTRTNTPVFVTPTRTPTRTPTPKPTATALAPGEVCKTLVYVGQEPVTLRAKYIMRDCVTP